MKKRSSNCIFWIFVFACLFFAIGYVLASIRANEQFAYYDFDPEMGEIRIQIKEMRAKGIKLHKVLEGLGLLKDDKIGIYFHNIKKGEGK